uniref:Secreted protein n=1 Tax=Moniliophthora roreri TaxID=221103 RepID=A0A0W0EVY1_MONRR
MHSTLLFFIATIVATFHGAQAVCNPPDDTAPQCETTDGSPLIDDCTVTIGQLGTDSRCLNTNQFGSMYTTVTRHGTCKIDACAIGATYGLSEGVDCSGYLSNILDHCGNNGQVGGQIKPKLRNQPYEFDADYRLQFSHN